MCRALSSQTQTGPQGSAPFTHLMVTCAVGPNTTQTIPIIAGPNQKAHIQVKVAQTTSCVRYLYAPVETGSLTMHTWQCPAGYDWASTMADPATDCTQALDGILVRPHPDGSTKPYTYQGHSGDSGSGTVTIPTMLPGLYQVYARFEPFGSNTDWHFLGACGADPVTSIDWTDFPGAALGPAPVLPSGGVAECAIYAIPPASANVVPALANVPDAWLVPRR